VVEGTMALTGYEFFEDLLAKTGMFPRLLEGIKLIRADEGRHLVHGMDFLREQLIKYPEHVAPVRGLFMTQAANSSPDGLYLYANPLGLDRERIQQISYANHNQRMREAGLETN
jgi:ribonucleotide reductase beta subunit family protein with ferritin-like domain